MQFEHEFTVPVPVEQAWEALLDVEGVAPCMPGATVDSVDGDSFTGRVKVKVGPMTVAYAGTASFTEKDAVARRVVVAAKGRETRGAGTAAATVTAQLAEADAGTQVNVVTDLAITGRPAQFGRGVMDDVGRKLLGQFAECLAGQLAADEPGPAGSAAEADEHRSVDSAAEAGEAGPAEAAEPTVQPVAPDPRPTSDTINLVQVAGGSVAKRVVPVLAALAVVVIGWLVWRGLRS